jgi:ABC-type glutathione transport system ATPase component
MTPFGLTLSTCGGIVGESGSSRTGLQRIIQSANS